MRDMVDTLFKRFIWIVGLILMMPYAAQAFSFGVPVVQSHLNEPLRIHLPLQLNSHEMMSQIFIDLAAPDVYKQWGLEPQMDVLDLHLIVHQKLKEQPYIEIVSYQPMKLAWLSFVLVAKKQQHRFYKQVKVLLDPVASSPVLNRYTQHENVVHLQAHKKVKPVQNNMKSNGKPRRIEDKMWARTWRYGPVRSGDSLSTIAYRLRKDRRYSNRSVMLGLYRLNPNAFDKGDMNRLKAGVFLNVPHEKKLKALLSEFKHSHKIKSVPTVKKIKGVKKQNLLPKFVGHISAQITPLDASQTSQNVTLIKQDVSAIQKRLDDMYKKNMTSHIRMDGLDLSLGKVHEKMKLMGGELKQLNQNQLALQGQMDQLSGHDERPWVWRWGLLLLFLLNALGLIFLYMRMRPQKNIDIEALVKSTSVTAGASVTPTSVTPTSVTPTSVTAASVVPSPGSASLPTATHSIDNHIYDVERAMDHQDYMLVESILSHLGHEYANNTRLLALKVRLHHEIEQWDVRNACVRQAREDLNEMQWRVFCDHLPAALWQALVVDNVVSGLSYENDIEEAVQDIDNTVVNLAPRLIVDEENKMPAFKPIEDMGFDGIPTVKNIGEDKPLSDILNDLSFQAKEEPLQEPVLDKEDASKVEGNGCLNLDFSLPNHADAEFDGLNTENDIFQSDLDRMREGEGVLSENEQQKSSSTPEDEPFTFEFSDELLLDTTASDLVLEESALPIGADELLQNSFENKNEKDEELKTKIGAETKGNTH